MQERLLESGARATRADRLAVERLPARVGVWALTDIASGPVKLQVPGSVAAAQAGVGAGMHPSAAVRGGHVQLLGLDAHGRCVWSNNGTA